MCERVACNAKGKYWVQRNSANLIVCGRHLAKVVNSLNSMRAETSHPLYHIVDGSTVTVKVATINPNNGWKVWK